MSKRSREDSVSSTSSSPSTTDVPNHSSKYTQTSDTTPLPAVMQCSLPPHAPVSFPTYADYEVHYAQSHTNRCSECRKNFPTEHFLNLHIGENHDPLNEALKAKGEKTYRCFVPECDKICVNIHKRRLHLIDKHMFPKNYDFQVVNSGLDKLSSMLRSRAPRPQHRRHSSAASRAAQRSSLTSQADPLAAATGDNTGRTVPEEAGPVEGKAQQTVPPPHIPSEASSGTNALSASPQLSSNSDIDALTTSLSALRFVPTSVRFGRGGARGGLARS